jgi:hypothetical protein
MMRAKIKTARRMGVLRAALNTKQNTSTPSRWRNQAIVAGVRHE